jgi:hypothetical protein
MRLLGNRMLNRIFWAMWHEEMWENWKFLNSELHSLNSSFNDFILITSKVIKCLGLVARLRETRKVYKIFTPGFRLSWPAWGLEDIYVPKQIRICIIRIIFSEEWIKLCKMQGACTIIEDFRYFKEILIGEPSCGSPLLGTTTMRGNNIKGLETSAECKTQVAFALEHSLGFLTPLQFSRKVMKLRVSELCLSMFYTTQYMLCFIRHNICCVLYDTIYVVFYTTQYILCFIRHSICCVLYDTIYVVFYTTQYILYFIRHSICCVLYDSIFCVLYNTVYIVLYDTIYIVFYTTQYMLCFIRHSILSMYFFLLTP